MFPLCTVLRLMTTIFPSKPHVWPTLDHMGISRSDMPQIERKYIGEFVEQLRAIGVSVVSRQIRISFLRPTQNEINRSKVEKKIKDFTEKGESPKPLIISNDSYILDGHHQWAALSDIDPGTLVDCLVVDLPMTRLLDIAHTFHRVGYKSIEECGCMKVKGFKDYVVEADAETAAERETRVNQVKAAQMSARRAKEADERRELESARQEDFRRKEQERRERQARADAERAAKASSSN